MKIRYSAFVLACLAVSLLGSCTKNPINNDDPGKKQVALTFSVGDAKQVYFAKGNLYAKKVDSQWLFGIYEHQYESNSLNYSDSRTASSEDSEIDLFTWGFGPWTMDPTTSEFSTEQSLPALPEAVSALINDGKVWRVLTLDEWLYLLKIRDGAESKCKNGVTVCGKTNCLVIAPDSFEGTLAESYDATTWAEAEAKGLICLPAAGMRNGDVISAVGQSGYYWTSTPAGEATAFSVCFDSDGVNVNSDESPSLRRARGQNGHEPKALLTDESQNAFCEADKANHRILVPETTMGEADFDNTPVQFEAPRFANLSNATKTSNLKEGTKAPSVSNSKQQEKQKETVVKVLNEKKFQKANGFNGKRNGANASGSRSTAKLTAKRKTSGNTDITIGTFTPATFSGEYYVTLTDANSTAQFFFDFDTSVNPFEVGKTYTLSDMIGDYVGKGDKDDWYIWEPATAATYTETVDEKGLLHVVASMTTETGTYNLTYNQAEPQAIEVTAVDWQYDDYYYDVYVYSETTTYIFELQEDLVFGKTYTYDDMVPEWVCTLTSQGYRDITATDASLTITKDEQGAVHIVAKMVLSGDTHNIKYDEKPFEPSGVKINVDGTDLTGRYLSSYGFYLYTAKWGDYTVQLAFDATEEKASYTNDEFIANYGLIYSDEEQIQLFKLASDNITVTETKTAKTLAGSIYDKNGDEYVLNLIYEKPDAKEINIKVANATLTNKTVAGFWSISGQTENKANSFNIYFISKGLQGTWTDIKKFDSYNTWVSDKSSGSNVYYEDLSEVNLTSVVDGDSLKITGTMNLADAKGNPAIATVYITTPFTQTWGEWADFAPFEKNTGKYTFATLGAYTQTGVQVQERKDNTGLKQYKLKNWGKGYLDGVGMDLILNMNPDYTFTFVSNIINVGADVVFADVATAYNNPAYASFNSYDPETGTFSFYTAVVFASNGSVYTAAEESLIMDKPITQRDTVGIVSTALKYNDLIASNGVVIYYAADVPDYYLFRVTSANATSVDGTFKWSDGTINDPNSYFSVNGSDKNYFQDGEFTVVTNNKDIALNGWMIGTDEKYYRLDMSYTAPTERDTVRFSGRGVSISACVNSQTGVQTGWFYELTDASTGYDFLIQSTVVAEKYGTFSYEDNTLGRQYYNVYDPQGNRQQFVEGSITVGEVGDELVLNGKLIAEDEKVYVLHFTQPAGVMAYDTDASFDATFSHRDMSALIDEGVIDISATNEENLTIVLELYANPDATRIPEGVYVISDSKETGTALKSSGIVGGYLTSCWAGIRGTSGIEDCWFLTEGTVTLSYDEYDKLNVEVDAKNTWGQDVKAEVKYTRIETETTISINNGIISLHDEYVKNYGLVNFILENDDYTFDLYAYGSELSGDFIDVIDYADCEIITSQGSLDVLDVRELKVAAEGKSVVLTAKIVGSDKNLYDINVENYEGAINGDTKAEYSGSFAVEGLSFAQATEDHVLLSGVNADGDQVAIALVAELSAEGTLPAGEYTSIVASTGLDTDGKAIPSAVVGKDGAAWFIQNGKLTVAENGAMTFEGVNSYDKTVSVAFTVADPLSRSFGYSIRLAADAK